MCTGYGDLGCSALIGLAQIRMMYSAMCMLFVCGPVDQHVNSKGTRAQIGTQAILASLGLRGIHATVMFIS